MKPIPSGASTVRLNVPEGLPVPVASITPVPGPPTRPNRRLSAPAAWKIYPWLLLASTLTAGVFCLLYITKPVIVEQTISTPVPPVVLKNPPAASVKEQARPQSSSGMAPSANALPGEHPPVDNRHAPVVDQFEETNLRVQHILTAKAPGNHVHRIDLDVPVLYQSRNLRWTTTQAAEARMLLGKLADYQEKSRQLRSEGSALLEAWNHLLDSSLPVDQLRADSPSLPSNQDSSPAPAVGAGKPSIQLEGK